MSEVTHLSRIVHPDDRARVDVALAHSVDTGIWDETYRVIRRDGEVRWIRRSVAASPSMRARSGGTASRST